MSNRKTVLVVDDIELNRAILCELFQQQYTILEAENGECALRLIEQHADSLSVVLLDVVMPVMDGIQVLRHMSETRRIEQIPVILITAESNESTALQGYTMGVSDIISKPFNPEVVCRRVENIIELYEHKRHLEQKLQEQYKILEAQAQKLKQANAFVIDTLSTVVEFRNCESGTHIRRIRRITKILLEALGNRFEEYRFSEDQVGLITDASALHDIGKIAIPDSILLKPGKLTPEEFEVMKTHTTRGCDILRNLDLDYAQDAEFYNYCYEICRHHHERWDGRGYPDGLKSNEISIWAQVVSLADVYEALTSPRVYKPAFSHDEALGMILNGECGAFNPQLLDCFLNASEALRNDAVEPAKVSQPSMPVPPPMPHSLPRRRQETLSERTLWLLELEREKYRVLAGLSGEITFDYDAKSDILLFSEKYIPIFGDNFKIQNARHIIETTDIIPQEDKAVIFQHVDSLSPSHSICKMEIRIRTLNAGFQWFEVSINAIWKVEDAPECVNLIGKLTNIHAAKLENDRLRQQAKTDPLTGLYNRGAVHELVDGAKGAIFFIDIDNFKSVNDDYGHQYGDEVLQQVGGALKKLFRKTDVVGRIGGDEFVVFLRDESSRPILEHKADEVCTIFRKIGAAAGGKCMISGSLGAARCPEDGKDYRTVLAHADKALYYAKQSGKDRYAFYTSAMEKAPFRSVLSEMDSKSE